MNYINYYKQMRAIIIYDLPMISDEDRHIYNQFHNRLKGLGFYMLQYSVYTKTIQNDTSYNQYYNKLQKIVPKRGNIILLRLTEKQFQDMVYLRGEKNKQEMIVGNNDLIFFKGN